MMAFPQQLAVVVRNVDRARVSAYADASGDHNPIHIDLDFARKAGMNDVFAQGMLIMAYLGRAITNIAPQSSLRNFNVRFSSITNVGNVLTCSGQVKKIYNHDNKRLVVLDLMVADGTGDIKVSGTATIER